MGFIRNTECECLRRAFITAVTAAREDTGNNRHNHWIDPRGVVSMTFLPRERIQILNGQRNDDIARRLGWQGYADLSGDPKQNSTMSWIAEVRTIVGSEWVYTRTIVTNQGRIFFGDKNIGLNTSILRYSVCKCFLLSIAISWINPHHQDTCFWMSGYTVNQRHYLK